MSRRDHYRNVVLTRDSLDGDLSRLSDSLERSDEDDCIDGVLALVLSKGLGEAVSLAEVTLDDVDLAGVLLLLGSVGGELIAGNLLDALDGRGE